jgi:uncharacterized protein (DUF1810 family)
VGEHDPGYPDPYRLERFVAAQDAGGTYDRAMAELRAGRKVSHPVLGPRLAGSARVLTEVAGRSAEQIFGRLDAQKLRSSMTLFLRADPAGSAGFAQVLSRYFDGQPDPGTDQLLG